MGKGDILFDVMILSRCGKLLNIFFVERWGTGREKLGVQALKQRLSGGSAGEAVDWSMLPDTCAGAGGGCRWGTPNVVMSNSRIQ